MRPILLDLPETITTSRLTLRPPRAGDGPAVNAAVLESLEALQPWMPWTSRHTTVADSEEFARRAQARWLLREDLAFGILDRESGLWAGGTGLHRISWEARRFEIGYWIRTRFSGRGLVTEAVQALTRYAFENLGAVRVEIRCDAENLRSAAVARRLGYQLEARLARDERRVEGEGWRDTLVFRRLDTQGL